MNLNFVHLSKKIEKKQIKIAVVGLGYVGLPLAIEFARRGIKVTGIDLDKDRLERLRKRGSYITDVPSKDIRSAMILGKFHATQDFGVLKHTDVVIICVPTPLKRKYLPDISFIKHAVRAIAKNLKKGSLVILESTTYPGTTEEVILPLFEAGGLTHGKDFFLSFSPERIDPGNQRYPLRKIPKVVGGINKEAAALAALVYKIIINKVVVVSSARAAELTKLLENTFRLVNIGLIDELAMMAYKMKINIWEVVEAASTKPFGFMPFYPGPGVGGHCIPKDPLYLYWKAKHAGFRTRFVKLASDVISSMPVYVVSRVEQILKPAGIKLNKAKILVVGVTYKKDTKDLRKSPSLDIIEELLRRKAKVSYFDPLIPYLRLGSINLESVSLNKKGLARFDCVIIATDHSKLDYGLIFRNARVIFDTRNVYKGKSSRKVVLL
ncbi:MAG: nucleotide sugar dehydrogenase [Candidatus Omnitrophica bacterium]|nr:nucleotide sugar dehydrogenase [Candidatus Omnitrophota bacterium]